MQGSALIVELTNEKDNLDARFTHSKCLIDEGVCGLMRETKIPLQELWPKMGGDIWVGFYSR